MKKKKKQMLFQALSRNASEISRGGVLPENLGRGVRPAPQNPFPIYDLSLLVAGLI